MGSKKILAGFLSNFDKFYLSEIKKCRSVK